MDYKKRTLRIQTILYDTNRKDIERSLNSIMNASSLLKKADLIDYIEVFYGDSSNESHLTQIDFENFLINSNKVIDKIKYLFFNQNLGTSKGHNLLIADSDTEYVLILNPDVVLAPHTLIDLVKEFINPEVGIVEARQLPLEHPKDYDENTGETSWASGACFLIKTKIMHDLGGFDGDSFFLYCDDVDLSWRTKLAGFKIIFKPSAIAFHNKKLDINGSIIATSAEKYFSTEASLLLAHKYSRPDIVKKLLKKFRRSKDANHQKAIIEFNKKLVEGQLPIPIDVDNKIAEFIDGNYAKHRF